MSKRLPENIDDLGNFYRKEVEGKEVLPSMEFNERINSSLDNRMKPATKTIKIPFTNAKIAASLLFGIITLAAAVAATITIVAVSNSQEASPIIETVPAPEVPSIAPVSRPQVPPKISPDTTIALPKTIIKEVHPSEITPASEPLPDTLTPTLEVLEPPVQLEEKVAPPQEESLDDFLDDMFIEKDSGWFEKER